MKKLMKNIFLKLMFITQKKYMNFIITYLFLPERKKLKEDEKLFTSLHDKNECYSHIKASIK